MSAASSYNLLVVDDEPDLCTLYELTLVREGYRVETAGSVEDAWQLLGERRFHALITDMRLPDGTGLDLLHRLERAGRAEKAIVITAHGSAENAVEALKAGAFDYLTKPVDLRQFRAVVASALGRPPVADAAATGIGSAHARASGGLRIAASPAPTARPPMAGPAGAAATPRSADAGGAPPMAPALARLVGDSPAMRQVRLLVDKVARSMAPVLVQGESGTGKELVARAIHGCSVRAALPFIAVNCGAIPEALLEAEFFGYRKGAFTGATEDRDGFFQAAQGGTLFLDEIGDLPLAMQSKLLRAIQERSVRAVGATQELPSNVRVVSATHKDLAAEVQAGRFRQDLYYRLNVIQIRMPALRERLEDLPLLCDAALSRLAADAGIAPPPVLSTQAVAYLAGYPFPGNVRELENLLHRAVALAADEVIGVADLGLPGAALGESELGDFDPTPAPAGLAPQADALPGDLVTHLDDVERDVLLRALERHRFNRTAAGARLGLTLRQMRYRMARLGIDLADGGTDRGEPRE